jgi:histamine receptor H3
MDSEIEVSRHAINEVSLPKRSANKCHAYRQGQSRIVRDRKAARSLFILVIVFLIFLFPYVICATASTAGANISTLLFEISFWLLWLNSTCNPFLYPFIQIKYRRAYVKLFQSCAKYLTFSRSNHSF